MKEKKLRIAFVGTPDYPIPAIRGGAIQTLVTALLNENEKDGEFDITVFTIDDKKLYERRYLYTQIVGIKISLLGKVRLFIRKVLRRLSKNSIPYRSEYMNKINRKLLDSTYDYVIFETTDKEIVQLDPRIKEKSKILYHIHADYLKDTTDRINKIAELVDVFVGVSDFISGRLKELKALSNSNIVTLKNAIEEQSLSIEQKTKWRSEIREKYRFDENDFVFLYCSRLSPEKGCLELEKALIGLNDKAKLLVVGGENFNSNKKTKYLRLLQEQAEVDKGRIYFTGPVDHNLVVRYMSAADAAVVPSICNEACSLTLLEYRAFGLPTIATNIGGIPEFTSDDATLLVELNESFIDNLSTAMKNMIDDDILRKTLKQNADKQMSQYYYRAYFKNFVEIIKEMDSGADI